MGGDKAREIDDLLVAGRLQQDDRGMTAQANP
jgi:hypothetical protein